MCPRKLVFRMSRALAKSRLKPSTMIGMIQVSTTMVNTSIESNTNQPSRNGLGNHLLKRRLATIASLQGAKGSNPARLPCAPCMVTFYHAAQGAVTKAPLLLGKCHEANEHLAEEVGAKEVLNLDFCGPFHSERNLAPVYIRIVIKLRSIIPLI